MTSLLWSTSSFQLSKQFPTGTTTKDVVSLLHDPLQTLGLGANVIPDLARGENNFLVTKTIPLFGGLINGSVTLKLKWEIHPDGVDVEGVGLGSTGMDEMRVVENNGVLLFTENITIKVIANPLPSLVYRVDMTIDIWNIDPTHRESDTCQSCRIPREIDRGSACEPYKGTAIDTGSRHSSFRWPFCTYRLKIAFMALTLCWCQRMGAIHSATTSYANNALRRSAGLIGSEEISNTHECGNLPFFFSFPSLNFFW